MAKLIKCPKCSAHIDVTTMQGNATVKCPECAASMRVPTGATEKVEVRSSSKGDTARRMTPLFRRMASARQPGSGSRMPSRSALGYEPGSRAGSGARQSSGMGLWIGIAVGGAVLIGLLIVVVANKEDPQANKKNVRRPAPAPAMHEDEPDPAPVPAAAGKPRPALQRRDGKTEVPTAFEVGAKAYIDGNSKPIATEASLEKEALNLIRGEKFAEINKQPYKLLPFVINSLPTDDEALAKAAFRALYEFCEFKQIRSESGNKNPVQLNWVTSAQYRGSEFNYWSSEWWERNQYRLPDSPPAPTVKQDINAIDWDALVGRLKGGGGFEDEGRPQGIAFKQIKEFGKAAWPKLANYLDHEDIGMAQGAAAALMELTGERKPLPNESNKQGIKKSWLEWISTH